MTTTSAQAQDALAHAITHLNAATLALGPVADYLAAASQPVPTPTPTPVPTPTPTPTETDSPDGYTVAPGGQTISLGGKRFRIGTDGKIYINDVVEASSDQVVSLTVKDGGLVQLNAKGDEWTQPLDGGPGVLVSSGGVAVPPPPPPPPPTDPATLPPVTTGIILPPGFRSFDGMTITQAANNDYSGDLIVSNWNPGDFAYDYRGDGPFIKDGVLGMRIFGLDDPTAPGASEVAFNDRWRYPSGEFWTIGLLGWDDDVNYALCWIYGFANGWWNPNGRASEGDQEMYRRVGSALGMHHINQNGPDGYAWVQRGFFGVDFTKPLVAGIKWRKNDSMAFFLSNPGSEPQQVGVVTKAQTGDQFIDEAMKGYISFRPTSYYEGDDTAKAAAKQRRDPMLPGWTGGWNGKSQLMQVFGFKTGPI
jgi:hypothetical protein